jgi:dihydroneopterin aldolase
MAEEGFMDIVYIRALAIETVIGIYAWERGVKQQVIIDLDMATDIRAAAASENIADALDYHAISVRLGEFVGAGSFLLIETLAERCAELVMREFKVRWLRLRLAKPGAVPAASAVGVVIERGERY